MSSTPNPPASRPAETKTYRGKLQQLQEEDVTVQRPKKSSAVKSLAQLSLEDNLQELDRAPAANEQQAQTQPEHDSSRKANETKPRLLLMGLRR